MPDAFKLLIEQAALKRDTAIKAARLEFEQTAQQIRELQLRMGNERRYAVKVKNRPIEEAIRKLMPRDRTFTMQEVIELMEQAEPGRRFHEPTVRSMFQRLAAQDVLKRVRRFKGKVLWAAAEYEAPPVPFGARPMVDVLEQQLRQSGPARIMEVCLALQEAGYQADEKPRMLLKAMEAAMRRRSDLFKLDEAQRWGVS